MQFTKIGRIQAANSETQQIAGVRARANRSQFDEERTHMSGQAIHIGTAVHSKDGQHLGDVDQIVIDGDTRHIVYLIIDKGVLHDGRLVEPVAIDHITEKGVTLNLTRAEAEEQLIIYVDREFAQFRNVEMTPGGSFAGGVEGYSMSTGDKWVLLGSGGGGMAQTGSFGLMPTPIYGNVVTESFSNVGAEDTTISEGTDVLDTNEKKIGKVDEILFDDDQAITGFVVKAGFLFHHDLEIPIDKVVSIGYFFIGTRTTEKEAEALRR